MSKRAPSPLSCFLLLGFVLVGCSTNGPVVNEIPDGDRLVQYNQAITEIESEEELEN